MAKILIVEDDGSLNQAYRLILEKEGHNVKTAFNGVEGLATVKRATPDVILLDMLMPEMGGLEFLRRFDQNKFPDTCVVVLSNLDDDKDIKEALRLGADRYILKANTSPSELAIRVSHIVNKL